MKKIRDVIKAAPGPELVLERAGGAFTFEVDVKSEENQGWNPPKNAVRRFGNPNDSKMDVDFTHPNRFAAFWDMEDVPAFSEEDIDEFECQPCGKNSRFHRP